MTSVPCLPVVIQEDGTHLQYADNALRVSLGYGDEWGDSDLRILGRERYVLWGDCLLMLTLVGISVERVRRDNAPDATPS